MVSDLRRCRNDHEVPERASLCPTCGDGGSLRDNPPGGEAPAGAWVWIAVGLLVTIVGRLMWLGAGPLDVWQPLLGLTSLVLGLGLLGVGVVAQGVLVGLRRWHHESTTSPR